MMDILLKSGANINQPLHVCTVMYMLKECVNESVETRDSIILLSVE